MTTDTKDTEQICRSGAALRLWLLLAMTLLAAACDQRAAFERFIPKEEAALGRQVFGEIQRREFARVEHMLDPEFVPSDGPRPQLERIAGAFPSDSAIDVRIIGAMTNTTNGVRTVAMTYEYQYPRAWLVASVLFRQAAGRQLIEGLQVQPTVESQEHLNAFTFRGKGPRHYAMLVATAVVPAFVLVTFVTVLRTKRLHRRWLWAFVALIGVAQVSFNWTTGETSVRAVWVTLLGFGVLKAGLYGPWSLMWAVPVGSVLALWKRRQWQHRIPSEG